MPRRSWAFVRKVAEKYLQKIIGLPNFIPVELSKLGSGVIWFKDTIRKFLPNKVSDVESTCLFVIATPNRVDGYSGFIRRERF